jgi:hypothetical protein
MIRQPWFFATAAAMAFLHGALCHAETQGARAPMEWHAEPAGAPPPKRDVNKEADEARGAGAAVDEGQILPFTMPAAAPRGRAVVTALGGYDSAASMGRARSTAEVRTFDFLMLRLDYEHGPGTGNDDRVSFGARAAILKQKRHGIDFGAGLFFQPKDFRGEGNIMAGLLVGRSFGRLGLFANTLFGADAEGDDASLEFRFSGMYRATQLLHVGLDARGRANFSDDEKRSTAQEVRWDAEAGPLAIASIGPLALTALVGPRALVLAAPESTVAETRVGVLAMAGAAGVF